MNICQSKSWIKLSILFLFCLCFISTDLLAQGGDLQISCEPGLRIYLDGKFVGKSTVEEDGKYLSNLSQGTHAIRIEKSGFKPVLFTVNIKEGDIIEKKIGKLIPGIKETDLGESDQSTITQAVGTLIIGSAPITCKFKLLGITYDKDVPKKKLEGVPVGTHPIRFERGGKILTYSVQIKEGQIKEIKADFLSGRVIDIRVRLRSSGQSLSEDEAGAMLKRHNFFSRESFWNKNHCNPRGDFANNYESKVINGDKVVLDHATGLMWHQSGSEDNMPYRYAKQWVEDLNRRGYAGYHDWRLPTLEEGASLLESTRMNGRLHIDPRFSASQWEIWTTDEVSGFSFPRAWTVEFFEGDLRGHSAGGININHQVRPVRSWQ